MELISLGPYGSRKQGEIYLFCLIQHVNGNQESPP